MGDSPENSASEPSRRKLVLVVDDDREIARMMDLMLRRTLAVDVFVANVGFGLLNLIASKRPDVVLLDVMLPGIDGQSLTRLIRGDADLAHTRVVLYSAMDEPSLAKLKDACAADDFVPKTMKLTEIARRIARWLQP